MLKNEQNRLDLGTLKSGVFHKLFHEMSRLNESFLHDDFSDRIIINLTANLLCIFDI